MILAEARVVEAEPAGLRWPWLLARLGGRLVRVSAAKAPRVLVAGAERLLLTPSGLGGYRLAAVARGGLLLPVDHRLVEAGFPRAAGLLYRDPGAVVERERWLNGARVDYLVSTRGGLVLVEHKTVVHAGLGEAVYPRGRVDPRLARQLEVMWRAAGEAGARAELVVAVAGPAGGLAVRDHGLRGLLAAWAPRLGLRAYRVGARCRGGRLELVYQGDLPVHL
ncbi:hypothetical protein CF15_07440 [Pyrodictium occultum]|uniref:Sugar fermentation stimulation protein C-terminal domain-containing protein n=1 Tax=Pyrodictium occultum TaxID=2309 RepID=A0A0V8RWV6_PYROC|nr:hypothetical protein [Pyrodictium occultum]KSW12544.1 hypothetical protein CF15_07440 [Pyrodictium occultum]